MSILRQVFVCLCDVLVASFKVMVNLEVFCSFPCQPCHGGTKNEAHQLCPETFETYPRRIPGVIQSLFFSTKS